MGDHTVAWQALVDALHASLSGLTLGAAIVKLIELQTVASRWMRDRDSDGRKLLILLDDRISRADRLEDAAGRAEDSLHTAQGAIEKDTDAARRALATAIAFHLTYLNYLPFATVPPASERGSHGAGEGFARKTLTAYESAHPMPDGATAPVTPLLASQLHNALWALFAFDAALRESNFEYAIDKSAATKAITDRDALARLAGNIGDLAAGKTGGPTAALIAEAAERIRKAAVTNGIQHAASLLKDSATAVASAATEGARRRKTVIEAAARKSREAVGEAALAAAEVGRTAEAAGLRSAMVLSYLLNKHQRVVTTAYPSCVVASGFLTGDPAAAAVAALKAAATEEFDTLLAESAEARNALEPLLADILAAYGIWTPVPEAGNTSAWAVNARNSDLVVSYNPSGTPILSVNGRAAAPVGVDGMGSHTTAWVVETQALNALVRGTTGAGPALAALQKAARDDLASEVMSLDALLPGGQLLAGQLIELFTAAEAVGNAVDIEEAARLYLEFRNLLPFATVDAGDRGGKGERADATLEETFDSKSLKDAGALQQAALTEPLQAKDSATALEDATSALEQAVTDGRWVLPPVLEAASLSVGRLRTLAEALASAPPAEVAERIVDTRWAEHRARFALARS